MAVAIQVPLYTVDDLELFPDDGNRYELLDGMLLVTPAPAAIHQLIASRVHVALASQLQVSGHAHVVGPGAVVRKPKTQLQPDILVYPARFSPRTDWPKITEHWLAVEILSRSSRIYDREFKRDAYFALGVRQVWLVDWWNGVVEVSERAGHTREVRSELRWLSPPGTEVLIDLSELFAGTDE